MGHGLWCTTKGEPLEDEELAVLQGINAGMMQPGAAGISSPQYAAMIGTSMSLHVLCELLANALLASSLATPDDHALMLANSSW